MPGILGTDKNVSVARVEWVRRVEGDEEVGRVQIS